MNRQENYMFRDLQYYDDFLPIYMSGNILKETETVNKELNLDYQTIGFWQRLRSKFIMRKKSNEDFYKQINIVL